MIDIAGMLADLTEEKARIDKTIAALVEYTGGSADSATDSAVADVKRRGRPRKNPASAADEVIGKVAKKRGRGAKGAKAAKKAVKQAVKRKVNRAVSDAFRKAAARRMKAYWKARKAEETAKAAKKAAKRTSKKAVKKAASKPVVAEEKVA